VGRWGAAVAEVRRRRQRPIVLGRGGPPRCVGGADDEVGELAVGEAAGALDPVPAGLALGATGQELLLDLVPHRPVLQPDVAHRVVLAFDTQHAGVVRLIHELASLEVARPIQPDARVRRRGRAGGLTGRGPVGGGRRLSGPHTRPLLGATVQVRAVIYGVGAVGEVALVALPATCGGGVVLTGWHRHCRGPKKNPAFN